MADQWEESAQQYKPPKAVSAGLPPQGNDWRLWAEPETSDQSSGFVENVGHSAGRYVGNMARAITDPIQTGKNILNLGVGMVVKGTKSSEAFPEQAATADAFVGNLQDRYGSLAAIKNTAYTDPVGMAGDVASVLPMGRLARLGKLADAAEFINPAAAPSNVMRMIPARARQALGERLYQSALKPPVSMGNARQLSQTGMEEGIPLGYMRRQKAVDMARAKIDDLNQQVAGPVAAGSAQGLTVDPSTVAGYTNRSMQRFSNQVNPKADLASIAGAGKEFLEEKGGAQFDPNTGMMTQPPQGIPLDEAQQIKTGTYGKLRDSYGEMSTAAKEAQKDLARGLKEEVYQQLYSQYPQLRAVASREGKLLELEPALERYAQRFGNRDIIGIGTPITGTAAGMMGGPKAGLIAAIAKEALDNPYLKSRVAIALHRSTKGVRSAVPTSLNIMNTLNGQQLPDQVTPQSFIQ